MAFDPFQGTDRYTPIRLLGVGGMGAVYEVEDAQTGGRVALKIMQAGHARRLLRFKREFRVMAELHHPNLVHLFELGTDAAGRWFFTMERVTGDELVAALTDADALDERTVDEPADAAAPPFSDALPVCRDFDALGAALAQLLDALEYLHAHGVVHRDLKPSNIMLDVDGVVRVLDFGLASHVEGVGVSRDGVVVGTPGYVSPEQYAGQPATPASDLFALGCVLFRLLVGRLPFGRAPMEIVLAQRAGPPHLPGVPETLALICRQLLAYDPTARPAIAEVRERLALAQGRAPLRRSAPPLVGRQAELAILEGTLARAAGGQAQLALVAGSSGVGKTRLVQQVGRHAQRAGALVLLGRCDPREQLPFVPFDQVVDALVLALRGWPEGRRAAMAPALGALRHAFPVIELLAPPRPEGPTEPGARATRARAAFAELLRAVQATQPVLIVIDDLQWIDPESLALLEATLAQPLGRVTTVGLYRPGDVGDDHPLCRVLGRRGAAHITLGPLAPDDAWHLARAAADLDAELARALAAQAEGNPFLVRRLAELAAQLPTDDREDHLAGLHQADGLLQAMLDRLSPRAAQLLTLAATAGGEVSADLLRALAALPTADFDLALAELVAARLLRAAPDPQHPGRTWLDVYHDRIRATARGTLGPEAQRAHHLRWAQALEATPEGRGHTAEHLLAHWTAVGDDTRRRRYAFEAAAAAEGRLAFARAARLLRTTLDPPLPTDDEATHGARWARVGTLFQSAGQLVEAAEAFERALACTPDAAADAHLERRAHLGGALIGAGQVQAGLAVFEAGLAQLGLPLGRPWGRQIVTLLTLRARVRLGRRLPARPLTAQQRTQHQFFGLLLRAIAPLRPLVAAEAALRGALLESRLEDPVMRLRALAIEAASATTLAPASARRQRALLRRLHAAERAATQAGAPTPSVARAGRAMVLLPANAPRALVEVERAMAAAERLGLGASHNGTVIRLWAAMIAITQGLPAAEARWVDAALTGADRTLHVTSTALCVRIRRHACCGALDEAEGDLSRARADLTGLPFVHLTFNVDQAEAVVKVFSGDAPGAVDLLERSLAEARAQQAAGIGYSAQTWAEVRLWAGLAAALQGTAAPPERRRLIRLAQRLTRRGALDTPCVGWMALALLARRPRRAQRALDRALARSSANTVPYRRWLCLWAAERLRWITDSQREEAAALHASHGFIAPGWPSQTHPP